ncbi:MAG: PaaI family thioesterase [Deltaproteobacteria bacterium]|nr:PaaI family thioesterase [Deltaproteobacteria bacterium]
MEDFGYSERVRGIFERAAFVNDVGIELQGLGEGWCETSLKLLPKHLQQDNVVHAGVVATMADHTAGAAAGTLIQDDQIVLTAEFKINLLRPGRGGKLRCHSKVLKPGRMFTVVESDVFCNWDGEEKRVAKALVTLAVVSKDRRS